MTLQELRGQLQQNNAEISKLRDSAQKRKDDKNHTGELITAEERATFDKLKTRRAELKDKIKAAESASDLDELLTFETESEERSRRGVGGRLNPNGDDKLPGEDRSYGDRFGSDRGAMRRHAEAEERRALATTAWAKSIGKLPLSEEERSACREMEFNPHTSSLEFANWRSSEVKRLRRQAGNRSGEDRGIRCEAIADRIEERAVAGSAVRTNVVPQVTVRAFELAMVTYGGLVNAADVMISDNGGKEVFPDADDNTNEGHQIDEVNAEAVAGVDPTFGLTTLGIYEFSSKFVRLANSVLRDAPYDIAALIGQLVAMRLVKAIDRKATDGSGVNTLSGILTTVPMGVEMAAADAFPWQELKRLKFSVDAYYRAAGTFMMNDETMLEYALLSDDHGRPLLSDLNSEDEMRLLNRPVTINNFYPTPETVAAEKPLITFGNHKAYKMKFAGQTRIERATERFIEFNQTGFIGFRGADGKLKPTGNQVKALFTPAA